MSLKQNIKLKLTRKELKKNITAFPTGKNKKN